MILCKSIKFVATRCHILRLKCTKFNDPAGGAYSAPPDPLAGFKGPTSKGWEGEERGGEGRGRGAKGSGGEGRGGIDDPPRFLAGYGPAYINTTVQLQQFWCYCGAILISGVAR